MCIEYTRLKRVYFSVRSYCPNFCQGYKEILRLLIDKGANVNAIDRDNRTALDAAFEANESEGKIKNNCNCMIRLKSQCQSISNDDMYIFA